MPDRIVIRLGHLRILIITFEVLFDIRHKLCKVFSHFSPYALALLDELELELELLELELLKLELLELLELELELDDDDEDDELDDAIVA